MIPTMNQIMSAKMRVQMKCLTRLLDTEFNPFDMEHRAKTAVKFGILKVVMLWPSQSQDFTT